MVHLSNTTAANHTDEKALAKLNTTQDHIVGDIQNTKNLVKEHMDKMKGVSDEANKVADDIAHMFEPALKAAIKSADDIAV